MPQENAKYELVQVRMPVALRDQLAATARDNRVSMHGKVVKHLEAAMDGKPKPSGSCGKAAGAGDRAALAEAAGRTNSRIGRFPRRVMKTRAKAQLANE